MSQEYSRNNEERTDLSCQTCGINYLRRLHRRGFLQRTVYSLFGYFPWECPICRDPILLKVRNRRRSRSL
jgi:DNA-directed RNA polymerase subunit RPC12/RpoP